MREEEKDVYSLRTITQQLDFFRKERKRKRIRLWIASVLIHMVTDEIDWDNKKDTL